MQGSVAPVSGNGMQKKKLEKRQSNFNIVDLMSLLLTLNKFKKLTQCFYCGLPEQRIEQRTEQRIPCT